MRAYIYSIDAIHDYPIHRSIIRGVKALIDSLVFDNRIRSDTKIYYIVMLDYDHTTESEVINDIYKLQEIYKLSSASMYQTNNGFHVIFFYDQISSWKRCMEIILDSHCDQKYKDVAVKVGRVNTRISIKYDRPDKQFFKDILSDKCPMMTQELLIRIKDGNKIRELYDGLMDMQIKINQDIWIPL